MPPSFFFTALGNAIGRTSINDGTLRAVVPCVQVSVKLRALTSLRICWTDAALCLQGASKVFNPRTFTAFAGPQKAGTKLAESEIEQADHDGYGNGYGTPKGSQARRRHAMELREHVANGAMSQSRSPKASAGLSSSSQRRATTAEKPLSRRKLKALRPSPSDELIAALRDAHLTYAIPSPPPSKTDFSYVPPMERGTESKSLLFGSSVPQQRPDEKPIDVPPALSLQSILANYIKHISPISRSDPTFGHRTSPNERLDDALARTFSDGALAYLSSKGYEPEDVMTWAWIFDAKSSDEAVSRLWAVSSEENRSSDISMVRIPTFLPLFLLRCDRMSARSLRTLLQYTWDRLDLEQNYSSTGDASRKSSRVSHLDPLRLCRQKSSAARSGSYQKLNETTTMTMIVRLLRHARQVWPEAIPSIAAIFYTHTAGIPASNGHHKEKVSSPKKIARLTFIYNRMLTLLSVPSTPHPFVSLIHHQRAQFDLLKRMSGFVPPLAINREGYRAVTRVQLAHKKTERERQWATMKAKSWPPWKEDKVGMDVYRGLEDGVSRARESMSRMAEAGYAHGVWEKVANIIAGWDTDLSPTIQTRLVVPRPSNNSRVSGRPRETSAERPESIWAARVRATRTVQEAWACFLAYQDEPIVPSKRDSQEVYYAMFEKLVFEERRRKDQACSQEKSSFHHEESMLPGDGKEVIAAPLSPREAVYIRSEPPRLDALFDQMLRKGLRPSPRCVAFLVSHAASLEAGVKYFRNSDQHRRGVASLLKPSRLDHGQSIYDDIQSIPDDVFAAFIKLLCRFPLSQVSEIDPRIHQTSSNIKPHHNLLYYAFRLMKTRQPYYRPAWYALLWALASPHAVVAKTRYSQNPPFHDLTTWTLIQQIVRQMNGLGLDLDTKGFHIFCTGLEKAVLTAIRLQRQGDDKVGAKSFADGNEYGDVDQIDDQMLALIGDAKVLLEQGPNVIRDAFQSLVGMESVFTVVAQRAPKTVLSHTTKIPSLLRVPGPAQLHICVRILGFLQDYDGLFGLIKWIAQFSSELKAYAAETRNGRAMMRKTLIATRVSLECSWQDILDEEGGSKDRHRFPGASKEMLDKVRSVVDRLEGWGGWPEDDEPDVIADGKSKRRRAPPARGPTTHPCTKGSFPAKYSASFRHAALLDVTAPGSSSVRFSPTSSNLVIQIAIVMRSPAFLIGKYASISNPSLIRRSASYSTSVSKLIKATSVPAAHTGSIKILSLNRPEARNAISRQLLSELNHFVRSIHEEGDKGPTRALILSSEVDSCFCAGADLKERATFTQQQYAYLIYHAGTFKLLSDLPIPTISAVSSLAFGGGLELALTTHFRVFASCATVALPETRLGIIPGAGGTYRLPSLIGTQRARDLILTGRRVSGPEAYFLGLCDRLVEVLPDEIQAEGKARGKVLEEAVRLAREICEGGPVALHQALKAVEGWRGGEEVENKAYEVVVKTQDRDEALLAFREKRKPVFKGR
ncbi:MAG: hypothetical protein M1819_006074 [Sarea resinae]|nr:MAG: hypothetical protein M1819_006074 [Sarea resinae]